MQLRAFLLHSRAGRILCIAVLALFLVLCGIHLGSAHHDADGDSFGLAEQVILLIAIAIALVLVAKTAGRQRPSPMGYWSDRATAPLRDASSVHLSLQAPLVC